MQASILHIEEKVRKGDFGFAGLADFRYRQGPSVDAQVLLDQPNLSLYCLDDERRQAVFVELPAGADVSQKPFLFRTQYQGAERLLTVPYETLHELAASMTRRPRRLILMYSVGRAGGTLVSRALNRLDSVLSLDEPDVYNNAVMARPAGGTRDAEFTRLLHSATLLLFKPLRPETDTLFIKFRSCSIEIGDLIYKAFPDAKVMFLYRNAETWARSAGRSIQALVESHDKDKDDGEEPDALAELFSHLDPSHAGEPVRLGSTRKRAEQKSKPVAGAKGSPVFPLLPPYIKRIVKARLTGRDKLTVLWLAIAQLLPGVRDRFCTPLEYLQPYIRSIAPMKLVTLLWLCPMHRYLAMHAQGIPMLAVRYETLMEASEAALRAIFEYCGLPADQAVVAAGAFSEDSQKDTPLSRDRVRAQKSNLPPELLDQVREVLREYPPTQTPDFVVPGSLDLRRAGQAVG